MTAFSPAGSVRNAALTAHRAVIHYRALRFATLKGKPFHKSIIVPVVMSVTARERLRA